MKLGISRKTGHKGWIALAMVAFSASSVHAKVNTCAAADAAALQTCINSGPSYDSISTTDTLVVSYSGKPATYASSGQQIRINHKRNVWIIGDTSGTTADSALPRIVYQDSVHIYTDLDAGRRADTSVSGTYGQNNGAIWIYLSDNIRVEGILVDGNRSYQYARNKIFAYGATLGQAHTVEIRGNVGINILMSHNVQVRYVSIRNTWNGIAVISPNLGGAFAYPDPNDPDSEVIATLPTSQAGLYGSHLIERCRIHDNTFGILFQRDWDLGSVIRNNVIWNNYLRHWADPATNPSQTVCPSIQIVKNLCQLDTAVRSDGSRRSLAYTTVGGAFLMTDVAITPYRIHNNTFYNNATIFNGYYKTGTQHLFYNNLVGKPYQFFRHTATLPVQASDKTGKNFSSAYTQTERQNEMLQYFAEHQRSNRVVDQDSIPSVTSGKVDLWSGNGGNIRLYNMRQIRYRKDATTTDWMWNSNSWSNTNAPQDSLTMTWVPDTSSSATLAQLADTGGFVSWIRHNMWTGATADPGYDNSNASYFDAHAPDNSNGSKWSPPWLPTSIRPLLGDASVFRKTDTFDIRWAFSLPIDTLAADTLSTGWLKFSRFSNHVKVQKGWPTYEGTATSRTEASKLPLAIGAYDTTGAWAAPSRRLVLRDTLIESVTDSMVKFKLNVLGEGLGNADIDSIKVSSAKFYNDVPVADTLYNQGPVSTGSTLTTTRKNSILSSKPWPLPYQFLTTDYDRSGYDVDDTLSKNKLSSNSYFLARIGNGNRLSSDSIYARAEVVLKAYMKDGSVVYSNPAVFMYSRPRFQFVVTVTDTNGKALPTDPDGISLDINAGQPVRVVVKVKTAGTLPVSFSGFKNLVIGNLSTLVGTSGNAFQIDTNAIWSSVHANDTVDKAIIAKNDSVVGIYRAMYSPGEGTLSYQARFVGSDNSLLRYTIGGSSTPLKVISGSIYQVTIDSVYRDTSLRTTPRLSLKLNLSTRDSILTDGTDTSSNTTLANRGDTLRVVMCVRDRYGNQVIGADSVSAKKGLYIKLAHDLVPKRYADATADRSMLQIDSAAGAAHLADSVRLVYDSTGHAVGYVVVSQSATKAAIAALRASIVDSNGAEIGRGGGSTRDTGVADTTWVRVQQSSQAVEWVDSSGSQLAPIDGWVGSWYPVRVKMVKDKKGFVANATVGISRSSPLHFYTTRGDTASTTTVATFVDDSLSRILWLRADDSTSSGWIKTSSDTLSDSLGNLKFKYPKVLSSAFYDEDCDGKVDSLVVKFNGPLDFRASTGVAQGDTLDAKFPHQYLSLSAFGQPQRISVRDSSFSFAWMPGALGAADSTANRITIANPLVAGRILSYKLDSLKDKAPPILLGAVDVQTWASTGAQDSVVATFSEAIDVSSFTLGSAVPFVVTRNGLPVALTGDVLTKAVQAVGSNGSYAFVFSGSAVPILSGDSLKIDATAISDLSGNRSGTSCSNHNVLLGLTPRFTPLDGYVIDVTGDGNADSVHLAFKDSLGVYPDIIHVLWGTPSETLTVTRTQLVALGVKTSDSAFTLATIGWHGQTIVIDGDTVRNAPRTVGPQDTALFNGGVVGEYLRDSVPPVIVHARLKYGPSLQSADSIGFDTLNVDFSEIVGGCEEGTSPAACLSAKSVNIGAFAFPANSTIIKVSSLRSTTLSGAAGTLASRWTLLVPKGSVSVGDSIRATPAASSGKVYDAVKNLVGAANWVYVNGDPTPPSHGWMMDLNGDGKVDAVLLHFLSKPTVSTLPTYQFEWGTAAGVATTLTSDSAYKLDTSGLYWIARLGTKGEFGATGYAPASIRMLGLQKTTTTYRFWVSDSVGPVLKSPATLDPSVDTVAGDTLIVIPSEPVAAPTKSVLLEFKKGAHAIPADSVVFLSATALGDGTWRVIVSASSPYRPNVGDSVRLSTSGSVRDTVGSGNVPSVNHPWVPLTGDLRKPYASYYSDLTSDGRVDAVTLEFAVAPVVGTIVRVYDPAGSGTYKQFTITAADSGKTTITHTFADSQWGANVTSWTNTNLGVLVSASSDTAIHGGNFAILDKVSPVIVSAVEHYTSDTSRVDTLKIVFSENIDVASILNSIWIGTKSSGDASSTGTAVKAVGYAYDSTTHSLTLYLRPFPASSDTVNPQVNDSVRVQIGVTDLHGNAAQTVSKWTVVTGDKRVFPPVPSLSNAIVTPGSGNAQSGDILKNPDGSVSSTFEVVARPSTPGNTDSWSTFNPDGTTTSTGSTYDPSNAADYSSSGHTGTVFYVQTNVPLEIKLYIYDLVGVYVASQSLDVDSATLAKIPKSKIGMSDIGLLWKGQGTNGRLVASGIYPARLIAFRITTAQEQQQGEAANLMYNKLMKVGVHLKTK